MPKMLVGRPGLSPVMVGRGPEIERLAALLGSGPAPAIALLGGEAGIGKTRLARELIARLPAGTAVHAGQADPGSLGRPFELLLDALDVGSFLAAVYGRLPPNRVIEALHERRRVVSLDAIARVFRHVLRRVRRALSLDATGRVFRQVLRRV